MTNRKPEQDLINRFAKTWSQYVETWINTNCKSRKYADVEYLTHDKEHWVIEAKSNDSGDAYNTVHKLYGELLKETGRNRNEQHVHYGLLIPTEGKEFYAKLFREIAKDKYLRFGDLIPVSKIFCCDVNGVVSEIEWAALYELGH